MCPNRWNVYILFYEQAVYERESKTVKFLLLRINELYRKAMLALCLNDEERQSLSPKSIFN